MNNDGGIPRRQSASYATWSRDHVRLVAAHTDGFSRQFHPGLNRGQSPEEYEQLFFYSKEQNTHSPRKGKIFLAGVHNFKGPFECELGFKVEIRIEFM